MNRSMLLLLLSIISQTSWLYGAEQPSDILFFVNINTGERFYFPKEFFPYDIKGYENNNEIHTRLSKPFILLFKDLLSTHRGMTCIGRAGLPKCFKYIKSFFQLSPLSQSHDFVSWFELVYFVDLCNLPSLTKDILLCHITKLMRGHEQEAAQATASIEDAAMQATLEATWKTIAAFYYKLFDEELEIEGLKSDYHYSVQQLCVLNKNLRISYNRADACYTFDLQNMSINSLEGWQLLFALFVRNSDADASCKLNLSHNAISFIPEDFLINMVNLKELSLANNQISLLPGDFLLTCDQLEVVNLNNNKLQQLPDNFLVMAQRLLKLGLSHNELMFLPNNFLSSCLQLQELLLMNNKLQELPNDFLKGAENLTVLSLHENELKVLSDTFLLDCYNLQSLSLDNNMLEVLPGDFLVNITTLVKLGLGFNKLQFLPDEFLLGCLKLEVLLLAHNQLQQLPSNFLRHAINLTRLALYQNQLQQLPNNFLSNAQNLIELGLARNQLTFLPNNFLINCSLLQRLDLADNKLTKLADNFLMSCPNLQQVFIDGNQLLSLPQSFLKNSSTLQELLVKNSDNTYPKMIDNISFVAKLALSRAEKMQSTQEEQVEPQQKRERTEEFLELPPEKRRRK